MCNSKNRGKRFNSSVHKKTQDKKSGLFWSYLTKRKSYSLSWSKTLITQKLLEKLADLEETKCSVSGNVRGNNWATVSACCSQFQVFTADNHFLHEDWNNAVFDGCSSVSYKSCMACIGLGIRVGWGVRYRASATNNLVLFNQSLKAEMSKLKWSTYPAMCLTQCSERIKNN